MPKLAENKLPGYRLHKQSGHAIVTLSGQDHLLGEHGSPQSIDLYNRLTAEWQAGGRRPLRRAERDEPAVTVSEIIIAYWDHARKYYRRPDGTETGEVQAIRQALRPLRALYGATAASAFGSLALKAVRERMVKLGWCRTYANSQTGRVRRMFKWAVENELVPAGVYHGLAAVSGLKAGRTDATEAKPVRPIAEEAVAAVLPHLSRHVAAMVRLQLLCGMRPGEVCAMRGAELDRSGDVWLYRPAGHKTAHHGHERVVMIGPQGRAVLEPFLKPDPQGCVFSPADAAAEHHAARHLKRKTPASCGNRPGTNRRPRPKRTAGTQYTVRTYGQAIERACDRAFPAPAEVRGDAEKWKAWRAAHRWHPNQLRHTAATKLRKEFGLEAAQVILGHRTLTVTQVYAEKNVAAARHIMARVG
jgi:integrase